MSLSVGPIAFVLSGMRAPLEGNYLKVAQDHADILDSFKTGNRGDVRKAMEEKLHRWQAMQLHSFESARRKEFG
jgi:DNA-binding GntR family transcriptional regulator